MKQAISFITLGVSDLARSRAFYQALGWRESSGSTQNVAFYSVGTSAFALFERDALAEDAQVSPHGTGFPRFSLAHNVVSDAAVLATLDEALAAGGTLLRAAERTSWGGFRGYFADPDGFLWEVCCNPAFALSSEGYVQLPV